MYRQFYYTPFKSTDEDDAGKEMRQSYEGKAANHCKMCEPTVNWKTISNIEINRRRGCLSYNAGEVAPDMTVLIHGHGANYGMHEFLLKDSHGGEPLLTPIDNDKEVREKGLYLTPNLLSLCIMAEGLPEGHRLIRMLSCFGAGTATAINPDGGERITYHADDFFARSLAINLRSLGYNNIMVGGYTAAISSPLMGSHIRVYANDVRLKKPYWMGMAKDWHEGDKGTYIHWYNGFGQQGPKRP